MTIALENITLSTLLDPAFTAERLIAAGMRAAEAHAKGERFARCAKSLLAANCPADRAVCAVFVPGRIEVLGKHTDYCGGRSLLCTVERGMCFVAAPRRDPTISFFALDLNEQARLALDPEIVPTQRHWSNYPMTVARRIARNFRKARFGADIAMSSDLPPASGLSSSSAMIVGMFMLLSRINRLPETYAYRRHIRSRETLAGYCGCIENGQSFGDLMGDTGVGTHGGSQDHAAILCCKPHKLSAFSFCPIRHEQDVELPREISFVIANSGLIAEKTKGALEKYNRVSERARRIVDLCNQALGGKATCVRDVAALPSDKVDALLKEDDASGGQFMLGQRLAQFRVESQQVIPGVIEALRAENWPRVRELVDTSCLHAVDDLQNQTPETVALTKALLDAGVLAASPFGAGFGGSVWGLVRDGSDAHAGMEEVVKRYSLFHTRPGCAALEIA